MAKNFLGSPEKPYLGQGFPGFGASKTLFSGPTFGGASGGLLDEVGHGEGIRRQALKEANLHRLENCHSSNTDIEGWLRKDSLSKAVPRHLGCKRFNVDIRRCGQISGRSLVVCYVMRVCARL
jgi:hypothetical protein